MPDLLAFALDYLECGWPVIPTIGKVPAVAWSKYQRTLPSTDQVQEWFDHRDRNHNLAVVTGQCAGLVVVDCDSDEDAAWWQSNYPQTPLVVTTGGGGKHLYYRHPGDVVPNRCRLFGRRIDLRADGGVVIAPPSIHTETRQAYAWDNGFCWPLTAVPSFDLRWTVDRDPAGGSQPLGTRRADTTIRHGFAYIRRIRAIAGSGGHNATFRAACKLRDSGLTAEEALETLVMWNQTNAFPAWSPEELAHKVHDAYRHA